MIPVSQELSWLVTTDALIEDIHFLGGQIKPQDLGHKALAVNLSDIAAMGGKPEPSLVQGAFLAGHPTVHAMMDVSDGVHSDIQRKRI